MALISGRYPFESLPRRCVRLEDAEKSLATMAGERTRCLSSTRNDLNQITISRCAKSSHLMLCRSHQGNAPDPPCPDEPVETIAKAVTAKKKKKKKKMKRPCPPYMASTQATANLPPVLPSGRPRSPTPRCGSFRSGTSMLRSCSGWRNIRSTGWTSLIAMRRHLCGAHSAKASPCLAGGTTRAYKTGQPPTASTSLVKD